MIHLLAPFRLGWRIGRNRAARRPVVTLAPQWPNLGHEETLEPSEALCGPLSPPRVPHCWGCGREGVSFCLDICLPLPAPDTRSNAAAHNAGLLARAEYEAALNPPTEEEAA